MFDKTGFDARANFPATQKTPFGAELFIVDDDPMICDLLGVTFNSEGYQVKTFIDGEEFNRVARSRTPPACVILDFLMPGRSGPDILKEIHAPSYAAPIIVMSGMAGIPMAVEAIKSGAFDFIEKPFALRALVDRVSDAIAAWARHRMDGNNSVRLRTKFSGCPPLTPREAEVLAEIVGAASNKETGQHLGISPRTVDIHRAHIMTKLGAKNTADLVRIALSGQNSTEQELALSHSERLGLLPQPRHVRC
jgi:FixJ family two-component response regulator